MNVIIDFIKGLGGNRPTAPSLIAPVDDPQPYSNHRLDPDYLRANLQAAVIKPEYQPRPSPDNPAELVTHCDGFVGEVASWYGFNDFLPDEVMANTIHKHMENHPDQWRKVAGPAYDYGLAIEAANQGCLLIAAQTNPNGHGHVAIIAPEPNGEKSGSWNKIAPFAANVGKTCWYGKRLSNAFVQEPETYLYIGS